MFASGFISLWRSILDWEWYDDINTTRLYIHLMLTVSFKDDTWHGIEVKRGSRVSSLETLSAETNLTIQQLRTSIKRLEKTGELTRSKYPKFTVFTLNNYNKFQDVTGNLTEYQQGTNNETNKQSTEYQQGTNNSIIKKKGNKKINNNISSAPQNDMYNTDYDFGYIPDGKDF
jgi:hypothetical protein